MDWFEDEEFWRDLFPYMFPAERFANTPAEIDQILALTNLKEGAVLDLCCGPGRHSVELARRGFTVTGVDLSPFLLGKARERGGEAVLSIDWVQEDMRNFRRPESFDLACSLFTSFGYFEQEDDDLKVLRNIHASLKADGTFIIDVISKERLARVWKDAICTDYPDGTLVVQRPQVLPDWTRIRNTWLLVRGESHRSFQFEHNIYSGRELKERLFDCGFAEVRLFGDLQGAPYGLEAGRLIAVAKKAPATAQT